MVSSHGKCCDVKTGNIYLSHCRTARNWGERGSQAADLEISITKAAQRRFSEPVRFAIWPQGEGRRAVYLGNVS